MSDLSAHETPDTTDEDEAFMAKKAQMKAEADALIDDPDVDTPRLT